MWRKGPKDEHHLKNNGCKNSKTCLNICLHNKYTKLLTENVGGSSYVEWAPASGYLSSIYSLSQILLCAK
jgi:hypothetical protein